MNEKFTVVDHDYINTGGNTMVSVFTVYDKSIKATRYVCCNEEGFNVMTFDTIRNEPPADMDYDEFIVESHNWDALTSDPCWDQHQFSNEDFLLYKHCQFEFYKSDCKYFGIKVELPIEWLPGELYNELGMDAIEWHKEHGDLVKTDGYKVWPSEGYEPPVAPVEIEIDDYTNEIIDFKKWFDDTINEAFATNTIETLYDKPITIVFNGRALQLSFAAAEYNAISDALKRIIDEQ